MALAFVQAANNFASASASSLAVTISTSAGSLLIGVLRQGGNSTDMTGVTDSASQTWTQISSGKTNWDTSTAGFMWYMENSAAVTNVTFNLGAANTNRAAVVFEISGAATSSPEDSSVNSNTPPPAVTSDLVSGALTTTNANDILCYMVYTNGARASRTAGSGYVIPTGGQDSSGRIAMQYQIVSATQSGVTTNMSWTGGDIQAASVFAAFKEAAAGAAFHRLPALGVGA